ncbi:hypothetical protein [Kiloniella laminariae]|uniref:hypothetical protein n=1 Tax=Kiloniella laminariae TaxID=454162 RepID=UPI0003737A13|nr:hypothetical protein [Kiloniella laminariae]
MKSTPTLLLRLVLALYCVVIGYLLYSSLHALLTLSVRAAYSTGQTASQTGGQSSSEIAAFFGVFSLQDLWVIPGCFIAGFLVFPSYTSARAYKPGRAIWGGILTCGLASFFLFLIQQVLLPEFNSGAATPFLHEEFLSSLGENLAPPALYALLFAPLGAPLGWLVNKLVFGTGSRSQYWS